MYSPCGCRTLIYVGRAPRPRAPFRVGLLALSRSVVGNSASLLCLTVVVVSCRDYVNMYSRFLGGTILRNWFFKPSARLLSLRPRETSIKNRCFQPKQ